MIKPCEINCFALPSIPFEWKASLPKCAGIYFVTTKEQEVIYIGRSANINRRWHSDGHHRYKDLIVLSELRISWLEVSDAELLPNIETALIQWFKPRLNHLTTTAASKGGMNQLRRAVGLKAEEVAVLLDISVSTVRNWEQGRTMPTLRLDQFCKLIKLYKCSPDQLEEASLNSLAKAQ